jgi:hypothetical protein
MCTYSVRRREAYLSALTGTVSNRTVDAVEQLVKSPHLARLGARSIKPLIFWGFTRQRQDRTLDGPVVAGDVVGDAPERSGSEYRHDAVRGSGPQFFHAQVCASE